MKSKRYGRDVRKIARVFQKVMVLLHKKTKDPIEALMVLKFGVVWLEMTLGVDSVDDSEIRSFIRKMIDEGRL